VEFAGDSSATVAIGVAVGGVIDSSVVIGVSIGGVVSGDAVGVITGVTGCTIADERVLDILGETRGDGAEGDAIGGDVGGDIVGEVVCSVCSKSLTPNSKL